VSAQLSSAQEVGRKSTAAPISDSFIQFKREAKEREMRQKKEREEMER